MYNFVSEQHKLLQDGKRRKSFPSSEPCILKHELNFTLSHALLTPEFHDENIFVADIVILGTQDSTIDQLYIYNNGVYIRMMTNLSTASIQARSNVELDLINGKLVMTDNSEVSN